MRVLVVLVGAFATWMAVTVQSVAALWYLCGDVVYCLLFPALTLALFDPRANRTGALTGLAVAALLRLAGGEPSLGLPNVLYPEWDAAGMYAFPFRSLAMACGLLTAWAVSRGTGQWDPPRPLGPTS
jgi:high affinity choline transporter 7